PSLRVSPSTVQLSTPGAHASIPPKSETTAHTLSAGRSIAISSSPLLMRRSLSDGEAPDRRDYSATLKAKPPAPPSENPPSPAGPPLPPAPQLTDGCSSDTRLPASS